MKIKHNIKYLANKLFISTVFLLWSISGSSQIKMPEIPTIEIPYTPNIISFQSLSPAISSTPSPMIDTERIRLQKQQIIQ
jgi:hypothetical protein